MKIAGQVVVFRFPQTDLEEGKLRPALLLGKLPGEYDDWLICMISSQTRQYISGFDEIINDSDEDFGESGLNVTSVIRVGRKPNILFLPLMAWMAHLSSHISTTWRGAIFISTICSFTCLMRAKV
jgi:mRNA interferase MazF